MEKITLQQIFYTTNTMIKELIIIGEDENEKITKVDYKKIKEYENYRVVAISPCMQSSYNETFKTMTIESAICLTLVKAGD